MTFREPADHLQTPPNLAQLSRRRLLLAGAGLAAAAKLIVGSGTASARSTRGHVAGAPAALDGGQGVARNVIFLVCDGMSAGALAMGDYFQKYTAGTRGHWNTVANEKGSRVGLQSTFSANAVVTDSAAASAAWSTGVKHFNGQMGFDPSGQQLLPLLLRAKRSGKATGVVTTTTVTHATPAGFYCNVSSRARQNEIAAQLLDRGIDLALGGGRKYFPPALLAEHPGVTCVQNAAALRALDPKTSPGPLLGVFHDDHLRFAIERPDTEPSLTEMAAFALNRFGQYADDRGFVLQIEAGRVDHAAHENDAASLLFDQMEFDRTIALCAEFTRDRKDTLLIITTDHGTANPSPTFYLRPGIDGLKRLAESKVSFESMFAALAKQPDDLAPAQRAEALAEMVKAGSGTVLGDAARSILTRHFAKERVDPFAIRNTLACVLGGLLADTCGVAFISPNHSADHVPIMALGAGADQLPGFVDNIEIHDMVVRVADLVPA